MPRFPFKGYCWAVGTTSFRTVDFNVRIERQLALLDGFWSLPDNQNEVWESNNPLQVRLYRFMQEKNFARGNAPRPDKDARQITSGLVDIGLINNERKLTAAGRALLHVSVSGDFSRDNSLGLPADSYIYLKQLLKTSNDVDDDTVRPFIVMAYSLLRLGSLSDEEFTYLLPLCTNQANTEVVLGAIEDLRNGIGTIDNIIISRLMAMDNYMAAQDYLLAERVTESVINDIGMNRKSRAYDKPYFPFYQILYDIVFNRNGDAVAALYELSKKIKNKPGTLWRQYLFATTSWRRLEREGLSALNNVPLLRARTETEFKKLFFEQMHLFKARANLSDYADLNRRYFKTTDTVIFTDGKVEFDILPRCWMYSLADDLSGIAFEASDSLSDDVALSDIAAFLSVDEQRLYSNLQLLYGVTVTTAADAGRVIHDERYRRFNSLIDERFSRDALIDLFAKFEQRDDNSIRQIVTNNADVPTIFEYVLGIAWYIISDRRGDVLSYMNLSLETDLLPRSHATGGNADIEYHYERTDNYPAHRLLIEATLSDGSNQRRMEMEPVSRHLGEYILSSGDMDAYCVFVSTFLHRNVISDFRNRRTYHYYNDQYENVVEGLKILPLATSELRTILEYGIGYDRLYSLFEAAYHSDEPVPTWYEREMAEALASIAERQNGGIAL
ncbi:MAG: AlwI family type II restriction endonuclease [Oscillospiraceae bacterium]|nr:AlwI family type II restriction endonuclease [Oscillospiraceae bacterium]